FHVRFIHYAAHAAIVVDVTVSVDDGFDGFLPAVGVVEVYRDLRCLGGDERIDDGDAFLALDYAHVRQVLIADLVNAIGDFEESRNARELRLPPETRIDRIGRLGPFRDESVLLRVPDQIAVFSLERRGRQGSNQAALRVV